MPFRSGGGNAIFCQRMIVRTQFTSSSAKPRITSFFNDALNQVIDSIAAPLRLYADANFDKGENATLVRFDLKGHRLGWKLTEIMIQHARWLGLKAIEG